MKKTIVITGKPGSGKTTKAKEIASMFSANEVVRVRFTIKDLDNPFLFSDCTEKTKMVVFEELYDIKQVEAFLNLVSNPITVNKRGKDPFYISPIFVLVCQTDITQDQFFDLGDSFERYFEVIICDYQMKSDKIKPILDTYEPFGAEWRAEMKKLSKDDLISQLKDAFREIQRYKMINDKTDTATELAKN